MATFQDCSIVETIRQLSDKIKSLFTIPHTQKRISRGIQQKSLHNPREYGVQEQKDFARQVS